MPNVCSECGRSANEGLKNVVDRLKTELAKRELDPVSPDTAVRIFMEVRGAESMQGAVEKLRSKGFVLARRRNPDSGKR